MLNILTDCHLVLPYSYLPYLRRLFADFSTPRLGLISGPDHIGFMVDKLEMELAFLPVVRSCLSKCPYPNGLHSNVIDLTRSVAVVVTTWLSNLFGGSLANCPYRTTFRYFTCTQGWLQRRFVRFYEERRFNNNPKLTYCTCKNRNKKPSNKGNNISFFP
jgi:hypothetical protein